MPVTFDVAPQKPRQYQYPRYAGPPDSSQSLLKVAYARSLQRGNQYKLRQSSVKQSDLESLVPKNNGFVYAVLQAYGGHHHLRIR